MLCALLVALLATGSAVAQEQQGPPGWWDGDAEQQQQEQPPDEPEADPSEQAPDAEPAPLSPFVPELPVEPAAPIEPLEPLVETTTAKTVAGRIAMLRTDGRAAIPIGAPKRVRQIIRMANQIVGKPYKWGGGHARLGDTGYDCSGAVSFALIRAGLQQTSMVSGGFKRAYVAGEGRQVTIYARSAHVYMEVAGLRLDTSPYGDPLKRHGVRWRPLVGQRSGFAARHPLGL
jgi:hypothetical protein